MLGTRIDDPHHTESNTDSVPGLGLLDVVTTFKPNKTTWQVHARSITEHGLLASLSNNDVVGYEIHMGQTLGTQVTPAFRILRRGDEETDYLDGAVDKEGIVLGTYLHGLFENSSLRHAFLSTLRRRKGLDPAAQKATLGKDEQYDRLADHVRHSLDVKLVRDICAI